MRKPHICFDTFLEPIEALNGAETVVTLTFQAFCDPCRSTKPYVEELAREHGFHLIRVDGQFKWDVWAAGEILPHVAVWRDGKQFGPPLVGAHTKARITQYFKDQGVIA